MTASAKANSTTNPSRREALNYAFGASIALALAGSCGGLLWFMQQRITYGVESGIFLLNLTTLPEVDEAPIALKDARAWLVNTGNGLSAFFGACPHRLGQCLFKWAESNGRFECPCCGSKFTLDGAYIEGPSPRSLDRLVLSVTTDHGTLTTPDDGSAVSIVGAKSITLNVNLIIRGKERRTGSNRGSLW